MHFKQAVLIALVFVGLIFLALPLTADVHRITPLAAKTPWKHPCPICGLMGILTGETKNIDGNMFWVYRCVKGHRWLEKM